MALVGWRLLVGLYRNSGAGGGFGGHMRKQDARRFPVAWLVLLLVGGGAACAPSAEDCREIMPVDVGPAVPHPTPAGTRGCKATKEGVSVQVEAVRRNLGWE